MHIKFNDLFLKMQQQLDTPRAVLEDELLIELINRIRPTDTQNTEEIQNNFEALYTT